MAFIPADITRLIAPLKQISPHDRSEFGGKAAHLAALIQKGYSVPPGFAISAAAFIRYILHLGLDAAIRNIDSTANDEALEHSLGKIRARITDGTLPATFTEELQLAYAALIRVHPSPLVAVRSSAIEEDSSHASFAGQYETTLNIAGTDALVAAIRAGWAGYFSVRAFRYRFSRGLVQPTVGLGLVVQILVDAVTSGILFTSNPITGDRDDMLLEGGPGMGEAYVSGQLSPDAWNIRRTHSRWSGSRLTIFQRRGEFRTHMQSCTEPGSGKLGWTEIPPFRHGQLSLTDGQVLELAQLGVRIERDFHCAQDIEWAIASSGKIYILQTRPITTRAPHAYERRDTILWTQRFSGERWTEPATTLGFSILEPILNHFIYFETVSKIFLKNSPPIKVMHGYPYFNITIFRHLLWKVRGYAPPQFILEFFPAQEQAEILAAPSIVPNWPLVGQIFAEVWRQRRWRRYHWNFLTNHRAWEALLPELELAIGALPEAPNDVKAARQAVDTGREWIQRYIKIHLLSLLFANLYYQLLASVLRRWLGDGGDPILSVLVAEHRDNKTVETNRALWELTQLAKRLPTVRQCLTESHPQTTLEFLRGFGPEGHQFADAFDEFISHYGHRSSASWEIFSPRWQDTPSVVLGLIRGYLNQGLEMNPEASGAQRDHAYRRTRQNVLHRLGYWPPWRRLVLQHVLESTRRYMTLRENQRFYFDKLLLRVKRALESLGREFVAANLLNCEQDLTLLTLDEVDQILAGTLREPTLEPLLQTRRQSRHSDEAASHPVFIEGDISSEAPNVMETRTLHGLGISPGRIRGPVRILHRVQDMHKLQRGDILVARATDPGWTPLFLTAGGLITELGSLLSHGAVVAREYNLPAVGNINNATSVLKDGQDITLDGSRGVVYVH